MHVYIYIHACAKAKMLRDSSLSCLFLSLSFSPRSSFFLLVFKRDLAAARLLLHALALLFLAWSFFFLLHFSASFIVYASARRQSRLSPLSLSLSLSLSHSLSVALALLFSARSTSAKLGGIIRKLFWVRTTFIGHLQVHLFRSPVRACERLA